MQGGPHATTVAAPFGDAPGETFRWGLGGGRRHPWNPSVVATSAPVAVSGGALPGGRAIALHTVAVAVGLVVLLAAAGAALAEPKPAGRVMVNGKDIGATYYRDGRNLYYPVLAIARALGRSATYDSASRRLVIDGKPASIAIVQVGSEPHATWRSLHRALPQLEYGMRQATVWFETRPQVKGSSPLGTTGEPARSRESGAMSAAEAGVLRELNLARTQPALYASCLQELLGRFQGKDVVFTHGRMVRTHEGPAAVEEAIRFLKSQAPLPPLEASAGLTLGARDHARDQGRTGLTGHDGSDGSQPADRVSRHGRWLETVGENIAYGPENPRDIVMALIIDDGVPARGHRTNLYRGAFRCVGVAVGAHPRFGTVCVMDLAGGFVEATQ